MSDINVSISEATQVVTQDGFGLTLVVATTSKHDYKEYNIEEDLTAVAADFATNTEIYKIVDTFAAQSPRPTKIAIFGIDLSSSSNKPTDLATALNTLITTNNNWYRILLDDKTEALITAMSSWAETNLKMFYTQFENASFTADFSLKNRTVLACKENSDRLDSGMTGYAATRIPGSFTFKFKNFNGITADAITPAELTAAQAKKMCCYFKKFAIQGFGTAQLDGGTVASGKFIDQIESRDWVSFRIQQEIAKLLISSEKVPYEDDGIQQIVTAVTTALNAGFNAGIIAKKQDKTPAFVVDFKSIDQISTAKREKRIVDGITFKYIESGAIHGVAVTGSVVTQL